MHALALLALLAAAPSDLDLAPVPGLPNLLALGVPEVPPALSSRLEQYQNARSATLFDVAPDGNAVLVGTRFASTVQLHLVGRPLGTREQLTFGKEPVRAARFATAEYREYRRDLRRAEYGDEREPEVLAVQERISPLNHVEKLRAPLLVIQGKNDPRVPQSEAEQIVKAVRAKEKEVWYLLALDEGHGFQKKENHDVMTAAIALFLERQLLGDGAAGGSR